MSGAKVYALGLPSTTIEGVHGRRIDADPQTIRLTGVWVEAPGRRPVVVPVLGCDPDGYPIVPDLYTIDLRVPVLSELVNPDQTPHPVGPIGLTVDGQHRGWTITARLITGSRVWATNGCEGPWLCDVVGHDTNGNPIIRAV